MIDLFDSFMPGRSVQLKNRIVMAPMTRTRADFPVHSTPDGDARAA